MPAHLQGQAQCNIRGDITTRLPPAPQTYSTATALVSCAGPCRALHDGQAGRAQQQAVPGHTATPRVAADLRQEGVGPQPRVHLSGVVKGPEGQLAHV